LTVKRCALIALAFLVCVLPASAARGAGGTKAVNMYIAVPASYSSTVTPAQAQAFVAAALGSPSDAPCIGSHSCSVEAWYRHEVGLVFDYTTTVVNLPNLSISSPNTDSCGSAAGGFWLDVVAQQLSLQVGDQFQSGDRTMVLLMGGGGWAGHYHPRNHVDWHDGMAGDWGTMRMFDSMNACAASYFSVLPANDAANGFAHEFHGMMGAFWQSGYNEFGLYQGDVMSDHQKQDLIKYSGRWLRSP
jgi:hypothetical protein